jgi:hypothetical protein
VKEGLFSSAPRSAGDLAGVFEHDGAVAYFYLYNAAGKEGERVIGAIRVAGPRPALREADVEILWNRTENMVALFIRDQMCAVFDCDTGDMFGGDYDQVSPPTIPEDVRSTFPERKPC